MRALIFLLVVGFALPAVAAPGPLSLKDISLMLRSGYSSQEVLQEISQRHVIDTLDPATRKSLVQFGASPALISVLEKGELKVDDATAENARQAALAAAASQEEEAEKTYRSAAAILRAQHARGMNNVPGGIPILSELQSKLVVCRDGTISPADSSATENKKLIGFYFSAHWYAPCRKFTPELVEYYNRVAPQHPEFQIVFVSFDRSRFNWETYLRDAQMPWVALDYDQLGAVESLKQLGGESIPSLLVVDEAGHVVASSYAAGKYVGPENALAALDRIFAAKAVAATR